MESRFVRIVFATALALTVGIIGMLIYLSLNSNDGSVENIASNRLKVENIQKQNLNTQRLNTKAEENEKNPTFILLHTIRNDEMKYILLGTYRYEKKGLKAKANIIKEGSLLPGEKSGISFTSETDGKECYLAYGYTTKNYVEIKGEKEKIVNDGGWLYLYKKEDKKKNSDSMSIGNKKSEKRSK